MSPLARLARLLFIVLAFLALPARAEVAVPDLHARVTDLTGTLTAGQIEQLDQQMARLETETGSQLAVLLLPTTQPETIEAYSIRVVEQWKLGRKKVDDGVLLLIAKDDHAVRFEVGYGLEGAIPDVLAKRIIEGVLVPAFRQGDFSGGIAAALDQVGKLIRGENLPAPQPKAASSSFSHEDLLGPLLFGVVMVGGLLRAIFGPLLGAGLAAGVSAVVAWVVFSSIFAAAIAALLVFLFVLAGGRFGGGSGISGGGFGSGGGGFSGGGGGFGGGGASGKW